MSVASRRPRTRTVRVSVDLLRELEKLVSSPDDPAYQRWFDTRSDRLSTDYDWIISRAAFVIQEKEKRQ